MADNYITVEAPNATKLAEVVDDVPIQNRVINEELGDEVFVTVHADAEEIQDADEIMDEIVEHSNIKASQITVA